MKYSKICPGCKSIFEESETDTTHAYIGASPGCYTYFNEILALESQNWQYPVIHRLLVDSYCVQHPGIESKKSIQSVAIHLLALYMALEKNFDLRYITKQMGIAISKGAIFNWLNPPQNLGNVTIKDIRTSSLKEYEDSIYRWARSVWEEWKEYHDKIKLWYKKFF
jgi:hypothetical protein